MGTDGKANFYTMRRNANASRGRGVRVHVTCVNYSIIIHVIYYIIVSSSTPTERMNIRYSQPNENKDTVW